MTTKLIPPPPRAPIGHVNGQPVYAASDWAEYWTVGIFKRLGEYNAPSILELAEDLDTLSDRVTTLEELVGSLVGWKEIEVDFGAKPISSASFTITDPLIDADSLVRVMPVAKAATGRTADDWAWDGGVFSATPGAGQATVYAHFLPGPIVGPRKVQYSLG